MTRFLSALVVVGLALALGGCATDQSKGPTYPVVGTVDQAQMEKAADAARLTYFGLLNIAAEYASFPRCGAVGVTGICSAQSIVTELRRYSAAADKATKGAVDIATNPTKTPLALANAVADAQRAIDVFRGTLVLVRPAAKEVK